MNKRTTSHFDPRTALSPIPPPAALGASHRHKHRNFIYTHKAGAWSRWEGRQGRLRKLLLLLPPPDNDHATGITGSQQALIAVEAHVQHRGAVALQLVDCSLGCTLHVKEVYAHILAARHCPGEKERPSAGVAGGRVT